MYESLLELHPKIETNEGPFTLSTAAGHERKTTGSYYTPTALINCLLDAALEPVVMEALNKPTPAEAEKALLNLKVCDPACGSGHFLIASAERLAKRLASLRTGDEEPSTLAILRAKRDIIGRCIYGVDMNPMAVELCKVSLWMEAIEPGKPLSFLDHHIRIGNSLLGTTPELMAVGLPDETFTAIEGDDKKACTVLKKRNKSEREGIGGLFAQQEADTQAILQQAAAALEELPDNLTEDIQAKELAFRRHEDTDEYRHKKELADAWCAAFAINKHFREPGRDA
ncbi:MAG TPA: N-6 DNA methylase, partial [Gemmataceae bacterium]|nr:N-6 DNA methylase [Gemmataceae bacterium]